MLRAQSLFQASIHCFPKRPSDSHHYCHGYCSFLTTGQCAEEAAKASGRQRVELGHLLNLSWASPAHHKMRFEPSPSKLHVAGSVPPFDHQVSLQGLPMTRAICRDPLAEGSF